MYKYQIVEIKEKNQHAGSKARDDVAFFAQQIGYEPIYIRCRLMKNDSVKERILRFLKPTLSWMNVFLKIKKDSLVLIQNPFYHRHFGREVCLKLLKRIKGCKIVSVIHDVECLRGNVWFDKNIKREFDFMKLNSDYEIVHNDFMKAAFIKMGFDESQLIALQIFDYKTTVEVIEKKRDTDVVVAGNLNPKKSPYAYKFLQLNNKFSVNLYGPNYEECGKSDYIKYNGSFPSDEVPNVVDGKFGLIWDGEDVDKCSGETGNYLRYNNPHKTSLYLVSQLPIIIWEEAAMAKFVENEKIGLTINSLEQIKEKIESISSEEYNTMLNNTKKIALRLREGYYLKCTLTECERRVQKQ